MMDYDFFGQLWESISDFDWTNLTKDKIETFIEADQFKAVVMVAVAGAVYVAYTVLVN